MSIALRQYHRTHHGRPGALLRIHQHIAEHGRLDADQVASLAKEVDLPAATIRAAASYYTGLQTGPNTLGICHGTSCLLAGADDLHVRLLEDKPCSSVYCLGYCDRSPTVLRADGHVVIECGDRSAAALVNEPKHEHPRPSVRCVAPEGIVTRRVITGDHSDLSVARAAGVYEALRAALRQTPGSVLDAVERSGERGRGGAAFPTGAKWRRCAEAPGETKYVVANGDEGDPGSYIDRVLMEDDPHAVLEGMALCAYAVGASRGIVFIRHEYPAAIELMSHAIEQARAANVLGDSVLGTDFEFDVEVFPAMGSYVCGEETAMLSAIEGFRGEVQLRPPYPVTSGLYGNPTVVNNVETLVCVPWIIDRGAGDYAGYGTSESSGTKAMCLNHGFARPGIVEVEFGLTLRELIEIHAGGARTGTEIAAVMLGGPMGSLLTPEEWDAPICYTAMAKRGVQLGHGGMVAIPRGTDWRKVLVHLLRFMKHESCGKCVPCSIGSRRALDMAEAATCDRQALRELLDMISDASLCAFGELMPGPMRRILELMERDGVSAGA
ncbi:MAG: protein disulfide oxidoreductase [Phycisphaera sp.]|nr:protein disulfide oxidoreductase [Phycisphaera sp.]